MITAEEIKQKISCRDFAEKIGLRINRSGYCSCPFHGEKTPSLKIYDGTDSWYCFGCHAGGDVISMAKMYFKVGFGDAINQLANDFGLQTSENGVLTVSDALKNAVERAKGKSLLEKEKRLREASEAEYLVLFDKWLANDRAIADYAPQSKDEPFDQRFVKALREQTEVRYLLEIADMRRNNQWQ